MTLATISPEAISEVERRALAAKTGSMRTFAKAVHNRETEPYQDAWWRALDTGDRVVIVCPPDTYKSSTVQWWVERRIGVNHSSRTLWLMRSGDQAEIRVMEVSQTIEQNRVYKEAFDVSRHPNKKWTNSMLFVDTGIGEEEAIYTAQDPDPTLMGCGLNGPYQGLHFDLVIIDDPTNQEDVRSPTTMELQRSKIRGVIMDRLVEAGRIVVILTRWGENDLVPLFREIGFQIITMPVVADYPWGPTISNRRFSMDRIEEIRRDKGDALFNLTYMCDPQGMGAGIIRSIRNWTPGMIPPNNMVTLMAIDPASSMKNWADPSCIGVAMLDMKTRDLYITDMWTGRVQIDDLIDKIMQYAKRLSNVVVIGVETVAFQLTLLQRLRRMSKLPFREIPYRSQKKVTKRVLGLSKDKYDRAVLIEQRFLEERLSVPTYLPAFEGISYEQELRSFPFGKHDDRLDVTAFLCVLADTYAPRPQSVSLRAGR